MMALLLDQNNHGCLILMVVTLRGTSLVFFLMNVLNGQLMQRIATQRKKPILKENNFQVLFPPGKYDGHAEANTKRSFLLMSIRQKRPEAERRLLLAPGGDEDRLLRPHVRDLTSHPSSANYLSHYQLSQIQNFFQTTNQKLNSPDLLVAMTVLLHKLVAKRVKGVLTIMQEFPLRIVLERQYPKSKS